MRCFQNPYIKYVPYYHSFDDKEEKSVKKYIIIAAAVAVIGIAVLYKKFKKK
jgi:hypothetical protein